MTSQWECERRGQQWTNSSWKILTDQLGQDAFREKKQQQSKETDILQVPKTTSTSKLILSARIEKFKMAARAAALKGQRLFDNTGVASAGYAVVIPNPAVPHNNFFKPGRVFQVRLQHTNTSSDDDAAVDMRGAELKFEDIDGPSQLDLILHTGTMSPYWDIPSFEDFLSAKRRGPDALKEWCFKFPMNYYCLVDSVRRSPTSYSNLNYYSRLPIKFEAKDGALRYAKFRLIPDEQQTESGLLHPEDQERVWELGRHPDETRPKDYLRQEYVNRLRWTPIRYRLQIQIHEWKDGDTFNTLNPYRIWSPMLHVWADLAVVSITTLLSDATKKRTTFNIANLPQSLSFEEPTSIYDYNSLAKVVAAVQTVYKPSLLKNPALQNGPADYDYLKYKVEVTVRHIVGSNKGILVSLTGPWTRTEPIQIGQGIGNSIAAGRKQSLEVEAFDVGEVVLVSIEKVKDDDNSDYFIENVQVHDVQRGLKFEFPGYRWLGKRLTLRRGAVSLNDGAKGDLEALHRQMELWQGYDSYKWSHGEPAFPGGLDLTRLPHDVRRDSERLSEFRIQKGAGSIFASKIAKSLGDYEQLMESAVKEVPASIKNWKTDEEFGRQFLNGVHPLAIRRFDQVPPKFPMTAGRLKEILAKDRGWSLRQEIAAGHMYYVDCSLMKGLSPNVVGAEVFYHAAPIALFHVNSKGHFVPVAIQLYQGPGPDNPIWTPDDGEYEWMLAKLFLRNSDAQIHLNISLYLHSHLLMEAFAVALFRKLPSPHPVHKLLAPHLRRVLASKVRLRDLVTGDGSVLDEIYSLSASGRKHLIATGFREFHLRNLHFPAMMADRGIDDPSKLPGYFYRDDGFRLWKAIERFVEETLRLYYKNNTFVTSDKELQNWIRDVRNNGFMRESQGDKGVPKVLYTVKELVDVVTIVIFTCSVQNRALTAGMRDLATCVPNMPLALRQYGFARQADREEETEKEKSKKEAEKEQIIDEEGFVVATPGEPDLLKKIRGTYLDEEKDFKNLTKATFGDIMAALPDKVVARKQIDFALEMSKLPEDEAFIGEYRDCHFTDDKAQAAVLKFQEALRQISNSMRLRNERSGEYEGQEFTVNMFYEEDDDATQVEYTQVMREKTEKPEEQPYTYLLPEQIPFSVTP
ncbi:allene oxide synthase-lipoxygenase protein-like [Branchiostoma lanceolatum]|uniref:allene oxide synthase-lipoxygenase protein-like n=1 Tax=Branchiostoma lanceolatum TaxID=7740 RepID=UPI003453D58F